jgi:replicative DNA helicase
VIDIILLRIMKHRNEYGMHLPLVQMEGLDSETKILINDFGRYFKEYPSHNKIDPLTFMSAFKSWHSKIEPERLREFGRIVVNASHEADDDQKAGILRQLADNDLVIQLANFVEQWKEGNIEDVMSMTSTMLDKYKINRGIKQIKWIDTPIAELLKDDFDDAGIRWRLHCLNESMRPLRGGDFIVAAGRPDKGKTSWIASETSFMAPQLPEGRNLVWLNNEGPGKRIIPRFWQATLGYTMTQMKASSDAGTLTNEYLHYMQRFDRLRVIDIHGLNNGQVEMIIEANNAGIVIYDMIDNIGGFGDSARNDLKLESMYQWARERCVKYDAIGIATSQISSDGDGLQFPLMHMLKDSKTGKQGACDAQIMIGASNDPNMQHARFIGVPKNKLRRPDGKSDPKAMVEFDQLRSRYSDAPLNPMEKAA